MAIQAGDMISRIKQLNNRVFERILAEKKIDTFNGAQGRILRILWQEERISLRELGDRTSLAPTTLSSMVKRMESTGLLRRIPDEIDHRKTLLKLTDKAYRLRLEYIAISDQMTDIFYEGFSKEEIEQCERMLGRIHENLKNKSESFRKLAKERKKIMKRYIKFITEKLEELMSAPSCSAEAKEAAQSWLDAVGKGKEGGQTKKLIAKLEEDIMPIDSLIAFADSDAGVQVFGKEKAEQVAGHAKEIKDAGAVYCDCPACAAVAAILERKEELLEAVFDTV